MSGASKGPKVAMVLAAGLGTRMRPLTNDRPKALVEVGGRALIDHMLDRLAQVGVETAVVNVHAFADRLEAHLKARDATGAAPRIIISDERAEPLETGGGIKHAAIFHQKLAAARQSCAVRVNLDLNVPTGAVDRTDRAHQHARPGPYGYRAVGCRHRIVDHDIR